MERKQFPSPFGVHVLKCKDIYKDWFESRKEFPSPFGVHVLKFLK